MLDTLTYYLALITLITVPGTLVSWLVLHTFVSWWRRIGPALSYAVILAATVAVMWGMYLAREPLLSIRFGVSPPLVVAALVFLAVSSYINALVYRVVPKPMAFGLSEISKENPGELVTDGIYSRMRHPRFAAMTLAVVAMAMITNFLALYLLAVLYVVAIALVARLEDAELAVRFGVRYEEYAREVPRFIPRVRTPGQPQHPSNASQR